MTQGQMCCGILGAHKSFIDTAPTKSLTLFLFSYITTVFEPRKFEYYSRHFRQGHNKKTGTLDRFEEFSQAAKKSYTKTFTSKGGKSTEIAYSSSSIVTMKTFYIGIP